MNCSQSLSLSSTTPRDVTQHDHKLGYADEDRGPPLTHPECRYADGYAKSIMGNEPHPGHSGDRFGQGRASDSTAAEGSPSAFQTHGRCSCP